MPALIVRMFDREAGRLEQLEGNQLRFSYGSTWVADRQPALSQSLPVREAPFDDERCRPFFAGLLPEGQVREVVARRVHVSARNDFALLAEIGRDCAGAVSLVPPDDAVEPPSEKVVEWLTDDALAEAIRELPSRPLSIDPEEGIRLSLAGAQDKMALVVDERGRSGLPHGDTPSTHILKAPIDRVPETVVNEAFCLRMAQRLDIEAVEGAARHVLDQEFLLIARYDRMRENGDIERLHQEDFCQALALPPDLKYEREGGPTLADCAGLIRRACSAPGRDLLKLVDAVTFNYLIGNHDAHAKNFSLLYGPEGTRLAPLYDLVSTVVYPELHRKMAMKIGGEYRPDKVERRHVERFAEAAGLGAAAVRRRMASRARSAHDAVSTARNEFAAAGQARPILDDIEGLVHDRANRLERVLSDRASAVA